MNAVNLSRVLSNNGGIGTLKIDGTDIPVRIEEIECRNNWNMYDREIIFKGRVLDTMVKYGGSVGLPNIKDVIFNNPATIIIWDDDSKTVVKTQNNEAFDPEKGLAMAIVKKMLGNKGNYYDTFKKFIADK